MTSGSAIEGSNAARKVIEEQTQAVSQMTASAQELSNLADELSTIVRRFHLS